MTKLKGAPTTDVASKVAAFNAKSSLSAAFAMTPSGMITKWTPRKITKWIAMPLTKSAASNAKVSRNPNRIVQTVAFNLESISVEFAICLIMSGTKKRPSIVMAVVSVELVQKKNFFTVMFAVPVCQLQ